MGLTMKQRGLITLFGGFCIELVTGSVFLWGQLNVYITSYFRQKEDRDLQLSIGGAIFPVMMAALATGIPLGIKGIKYFGSARTSCIISSIIAAAMVFISSYTERFWQFILIYGIIFGVAQGSIYFVPIYMGYLYFPNNKGMVAGIVTGGFAICSFIFGLIFFAIVNPDGLSQVKNDDGYSYFEADSIEVARNVPDTLRKMSYMYLGVSVFSSLFLLYHPNQIGEEEKRLKQQLKEQQDQKLIVNNQLNKINELTQKDILNQQNMITKSHHNYDQNQQKQIVVQNKEIELQKSIEINHSKQANQKLKSEENQPQTVLSQENEEENQKLNNLNHHQCGQQQIIQNNKIDYVTKRKMSILNKTLQLIEMEQESLKRKITLSHQKDEQASYEAICFKSSDNHQITIINNVLNASHNKSTNYEVRHSDPNFIWHKIIKLDSHTNKVQHTNEFLVDSKELTELDEELDKKEKEIQNELETIEYTVEQIEAYNKLGAPTAGIALKQPQLYISILLGILSLGLGVLVNGNYKSIAKDYGFTEDSYQVLVGSLGGVANGLSRPMWSTLLDKFTFKQIISVILLIQIVCSFTLQLTDSNKAFFIIWVFIIHMTMGAVLGMWPVLSAQLNGVKAGSQLFGLYWYGFSCATLLQFFLVYALKTVIGFNNLYYIYAAQSIIAFIIVQKYKFKVNWSKYYIQSQQSQSTRNESDRKASQ